MILKCSETENVWHREKETVRNPMHISYRLKKVVTIHLLILLQYIFLLSQKRSFRR